MEKYYAALVEVALHHAEQNFSKITSDIIKIGGMSGTKTRHFYNNLLNIPDARYLEIGTWRGSSVCSAMCNNKAKVLCIDNWSEFNDDVSKTEFFDNFEKFKGANDATFIENDCFRVDVSALPKFNIFMYDGNHSEECQYMALKHYYRCLDDVFIFIVDDWNWEAVRTGTLRSIRDLNLTVVWEKDIRVIWNDDDWKNARETWWNGMYVVVLKKGETSSPALL